MSDLRTGLVEAMAKAMYHAGVPMEGPGAGHHFPRRAAHAALDAALGFLSDNAKDWAVAIQPLTTSDVVRDLIAVLSDSRDTGEKP